MMCKDLPPQNWRSLFPISTGFSISMSAGCTKRVTHSKKKWRVALNSAFCRVSQTLSYSSTVQLGMQDTKQRHKTQNIDGMDFPTGGEGFSQGVLVLLKFSWHTHIVSFFFYHLPSKGWGKIIVSVCSHFGGGLPDPALHRGDPMSQIFRGVPCLRFFGGVPCLRFSGGPRSQILGGVPGLRFLGGTWSQ